MAGKGFAKVTIKGKPETMRALHQVGEFDEVEAAHRAGDNLIPYIVQGTRVLSGALRSGFEMRDAYIENTEDYATAQEYGTVYVDATLAIAGAADSHPEALVEGFEDVIDDEIRQAGFSYF